MDLIDYLAGESVRHKLASRRAQINDITLLREHLDLALHHLAWAMNYTDGLPEDLLANAYELVIDVWQEHEFDFD